MGRAPILRNTMMVAAAVALAAACESEKKSLPVNAYDVAEVRTDRAPIEARFPELGPFAEVTWIGAAWGVVPERISVPGPTDVRVVGVARLSPADLERLTGQYAWATCGVIPRQVPKPLASAVNGSGGGGTWCSDPAMARQVGAESSWSFLLDKARGVVYFDSVNMTATDPTTPANTSDGSS